MAVALDSLGRVATAEGRGERAALLLGAAEGVWDVVGMSETGNPFAFAPSRSDGLQQARRLLGKQRFRELFRRGSQLSMDDAVRFALDAEADEGPRPARAEPSPLTKRERRSPTWSPKACPTPRSRPGWSSPYAPPRVTWRTSCASSGSAPAR